MRTLTRKKTVKKYDLPVEEIKQMLDEGKRQRDGAELFGVSQCTISRLASMPVKSPKGYRENIRLCTCCHQQPIATGNRFLCATCFRHSDQEEHLLWA